MSVQDLPAGPPALSALEARAIRPVPLACGLALLAAAWLGPLPALARTAFWAHMTMHMAVVAIAAPLLALAVANTRLDPARRWPLWFAPIPASLIELAVVWSWHAPALHQAARHEPEALFLEQTSFLAAGLLLWLAALGGEGERLSDHRRSGSGPGLLAGGRRGPRGPRTVRSPTGESADRVEARAHRPVALHARAGPPARSPGPLLPPQLGRQGAGVVALLLTSMHMTLLGALLALSPRPLYGHAHGSFAGLAPLDDQHLGGAVMLLVGGASYLLGGLVLMARLLRAPVAQRSP